MTTHIRFGGVGGGGSSVYSPSPTSAETLTASGTSQQTTITAAAGEYCTVETNEAVFVSIGRNPVAASGSGDMVQSTKDFGPLQSGDKVAVITVA